MARALSSDKPMQFLAVLFPRTDGIISYVSQLVGGQWPMVTVVDSSSNRWVKEMNITFPTSLVAKKKALVDLSAS